LVTSYIVEPFKTPPLELMSLMCSILGALAEALKHHMFEQVRESAAPLRLKAKPIL